jgi:peroxiredoxin
MSSLELALAPELVVSDWLNTAEPITLAQLRGQVVVIHAFQMLCPGCVSHGIPQIKLLHEYYDDQPVSVIGLHSVFEHHDAMQKHALKAFAHEYRLNFPIAIDLASEIGPIPETMQRYSLRGTPSLIVIDQQGRLRLNHFGHIDNLAVGNLIGTLLTEHSLSQNNALGQSDEKTSEASGPSHCNEEGCVI